MRHDRSIRANRVSFPGWKTRMNRGRWLLALASLISGTWPVRADGPVANTAASPTLIQPQASTWHPLPFSAVILQDPFTVVNDKKPDDREDGNGKSQAPARERPKHIR